MQGYKVGGRIVFRVPLLTRVLVESWKNRKDHAVANNTEQLKQARKILEQESSRYIQTILDCQKKFHRLTVWEQEFINNLARGFENNHLTIRNSLTEKQEKTLQQIERKVYDIG